ncbi:MAG: CapA family protein [archaeon GB-1867-005]|nr:CapA family protein [Candidatus Culexmicrobium cathedralense]
MSENRCLTLAATGDSFIATRLSVYNEPEFMELIEIIRSAHVRFTNLEVLINDFKGYPAAQSGGTYASAESYVADELKWMGFNIVSRANNHAMDYRLEGMLETTKNLNRVGIIHAGVGMNLGEARSPSYLDTSVGRVALISAASTFPREALAGNARPDLQGRPGVNPLRYSAQYTITKEAFKDLVEIAKLLGYKLKEPIEKLRLFGATIIAGDKVEVEFKINKQDEEGNLRAIKDAKRMADFVIFSLHAHERFQSIEKPAPFIEYFARKCIDAGADIFIGHGPHVLRGIEIYKGKPIFYSLGNFIFQNDLIKKQPADLYERYKLDWRATPADLYDAREKGLPEYISMGFKWFTSDSKYWETVLAYCTYVDCKLVEVRLYPVDLGFGKSRWERGRPMLAKGAKAEKIIRRVKELSKVYGTEIKFKDGIGIIELN